MFNRFLSNKTVTLPANDATDLWQQLVGAKAEVQCEVFASQRLFHKMPITIIDSTRVILDIYCTGPYIARWV